jgi:hypothetical protein
LPCLHPSLHLLFEASCPPLPTHASNPDLHLALLESLAPIWHFGPFPKHSLDTALISLKSDLKLPTYWLELYPLLVRAELAHTRESLSGKPQTNDEGEYSKLTHQISIAVEYFKANEGKGQLESLMRSLIYGFPLLYHTLGLPEGYKHFNLDSLMW